MFVRKTNDIVIKKIVTKFHSLSHENNKIK